MPRKNLGRNDKCSCGSGKKYKICCMHLEQTSKLSLEDMLKAVRKQYASARYCLHFDAPIRCAGQIIEAHSIQRSGGLTCIAENGKVMDFNGEGATILKGQSCLPRLVGIKDASIFTGFCQMHDNNVFSPLETRQFCGNDQQCFLLACRAICHRLYEKRITAKIIEWMQEKGKNIPAAERRASWQEISSFVSGHIAQRDRTLIEKQQYDAFLRVEDYSFLNSYIVNLSNIPDLLCSGAFCPRFDFDGNTLQSSRDVFDIITCSVIPTSTGGAVVFSWLLSSPACRQFVESLHALDDHSLAQAIARLLFHSIKTMYGRATWWQNLDQSMQKQLMLRRQAGMKGVTLRQPNIYKDDGLKIVDWQIASRDLKLVM